MGEGQRENPKQALCTVSTEPDTGLSPVTCKIMTQAKIKESDASPTKLLRHPNKHLIC